MTRYLKATTVSGRVGSPILMGDWDSSPVTTAFWTPQLSAGTLQNTVDLTVVAQVADGAGRFGLAVEIAVTDSDGSSPTVVAFCNCSAAFSASGNQTSWKVPVRTTTITAGQRLRLRFFIDDDEDNLMTGGDEARLFYEHVDDTNESITLGIPNDGGVKIGQIQQQDYRWRDDDDSESAATWLESENTSHEFNLAGSPDSNVKARLRFEVYNPGSPNATAPLGFLLELQRATAASSPETRVPYDFTSFVSSGDSYVSGDDDLAGINDTGTVFFTIRESNDTVYDHTCTAYDLTSASSGGDSLSCATQTSNLAGGVFSPDGTKLFVFCGATKILYRYSGTAWDLSTFSYDTGQTYTGQGNGWWGLAFSPDGLIAYQAGSGVDDEIYQHTLTTAWDLTSASYASKSIALPSTSMSASLLIIGNGKILITGGSDSSAYVSVYVMSTPYDISTATYLGDYAAGYNHGYADFFTDNGTQRWTHYFSGTTMYSAYTSAESDWLPVTVGIYAKAFDSTNLTDEADTTVQMGGSPYLSDNNSVTEDGVSAATELAVGQYAEIEFTVEFIADDLSDGETVRFRLKGADSYS